MIQSIKRGEVDVVLAWHPDRLHRQLRELVGFIDVVNDHGVGVESVRAGVYDRSTPSGRMQAAIAGAVAQHESEHKSDRIRRKLEANAAEGRHHGGSRPYGWNDDRITLHSGESTVVRKAVRLALSGMSMRGVARELNASGARTATGRAWIAVTVRDMLLRRSALAMQAFESTRARRLGWSGIGSRSSR
jgi:DNA invertase Pin-like site-specific DNA recombinase